MIIEGESTAHCSNKSHLTHLLVLTLYEKGAAKRAKHAWTLSTTSIGALSYIAVRCFQYSRQQQFRAVECVNTHTKRFILLSPFAFLCIIPQNSFRRSSSGRFIELRPGPFWDTFHALMAEKEAILTAVRVLLKPSRQNRMETNTGDENGDY
jgi:hypothetical protein